MQSFKLCQDRRKRLENLEGAQGNRVGGGQCLDLRGKIAGPLLQPHGDAVEPWIGETFLDLQHLADPLLNDM